MSTAVLCISDYIREQRSRDLDYRCATAAPVVCVMSRHQVGATADFSLDYPNMTIMRETGLRICLEAVPSGVRNL